MTNANDMQVGGDHYTVASPLTPREVRALRGRLKHWDVIAIMGWDYFIGNITKYFHRHDKKNGWEDAKKGYHYAVKWMENEYPEEFADLQEEQSEALFANWEQADGSELPTWLVDKVWRGSRADLTLKKIDSALNASTTPVLTFAIPGAFGFTAVKIGDQLCISDDMEKLTFSASPAEWLALAKGKVTAPALLLSQEEADVILRVFDAGKITALKAVDDAPRRELMHRLRAHLRPARANLEPSSISGAGQVDAPGREGSERLGEAPGVHPNGGPLA